MTNSKKPKAGDQPLKTKIAAITSTGDLKADEANPRKIGAAATKGLANSLEKFGDLSGIVFNSKTGELVAGHQRLSRIESKWGSREIEPVDEAAGIYGIRIDDEQPLIEVAENHFASCYLYWEND